MNGTLHPTSHFYVNLLAGKTAKKSICFWEQQQILHPGVVTGMLESFLAFTMEHTLDGSSVRHMTSSLFRTMAMNYDELWDSDNYDKGGFVGLTNRNIIILV